MEVKDPGHYYMLRPLDGNNYQWLQFVKRIGEGFPGNEGLPWSGTTTQEVLRALIDRGIYVNNQVPCDENVAVIAMMKYCVYLLEVRAAKRHGRSVWFSIDDAVAGPGCSYCGHVGCQGECRGHHVEVQEA